MLKFQLIPWPASFEKIILHVLQNFTFWTYQVLFLQRRYAGRLFSKWVQFTPKVILFASTIHPEWSVNHRFLLWLLNRKLNLNRFISDVSKSESENETAIYFRIHFITILPVSGLTIWFESKMIQIHFCGHSLLKDSYL